MKGKHWCSMFIWSQRQLYDGHVCYMRKVGIVRLLFLFYCAWWVFFLSDDAFVWLELTTQEPYSSELFHARHTFSAFYLQNILFFSPSFCWPLITKLDSVNCRNAFLATVFRTEVLRESDDATDIHLFCWDVKIINIVTDTKFIEVLLWITSETAWWCGRRLFCPPFFPTDFFFIESFGVKFQSKGRSKYIVVATFSIGSSSVLKLFLKFKFR